MLMQLDSRVGEWPGQAKWVVRSLGRFDVVMGADAPAKFRSRTAASLLAYLVLNLGREVSRFVLEETFWPDSDGDRQSQNLRRAISDLRDVLEDENQHGTVIETKRDVVAASARFLASDASRFLECTDHGLHESDEESLYEAITLYSGPLLAHLHDEWIYSYRLEYEERYAQAVAELCRLRIKAGAGKEAVRIGRTALLAAPTREDVHLALIHAYRSVGLEAEALRQFEDLERVMDENWGEPPSMQAREALEGDMPKAVAPISPSQTAPDSEPVGGAMALTSRFYVRRAADAEAEACIVRGESVILVQGPRQVGKSSLLARIMAFARENERRTVMTDFQTIGESQLADEERLYRALAHSFASQIKVAIDLMSAWNDWLGPNMNLDTIIGGLLEQAEGPVVWGFDEADSLFGRALTNDFFGLLRSWHNRRALDPGGPWSKLSLVISYATEAHLFISDLNQSPFNVGVRLPLRDFSRDEVTELASRYGISKSEEINTTIELANGHPFLTRRALAFLSQSEPGKATANQRCNELRATCSLEDGPFADHLHRIFTAVSFDKEVLEDVRNLIVGKPMVHLTTRHRLMAAGVLAMSPDAKPKFRVPAYEPYLRGALG